MKENLNLNLSSSSSLNYQNITDCQRDYHRIALAIKYLTEHVKEQPCLNKIASELNLSPFHFQRLFSKWSGVSPKKFIQYFSVEYAKNLIKNNQESLLNIAYDTGLTSSSRLYDLFIKIEAMSPGEYKSGGSNLRINYSYSSSIFGNLLVASTKRGICYISFIEDKEKALKQLKKIFPNSTYFKKTDSFQQSVLKVFENLLVNSLTSPIKLHLYGSNFQLKVWESLLKIPMGELTTYGSIAKAINYPKAARAVGSAIRLNPVAFLIPCHRVIQSTGKIGGYSWGATRKKTMIAWEASMLEKARKN